ncbi:MAG: STAS domain-containing protein [Pseudonocardiaceae bacterium]
MLVVTGPCPALHAQLRALLGAGATVVICDVAAITDPDPRTVDALLRLALTARRCGGRIRLVNVRVGLRDLLTCSGFADILGVPDSAP